jgi:hypothetical protein
METTDKTKSPQQLADVVYDLPVAWLHLPRTARQMTEAKSGDSKMWPLVAVAAAGALTGGGLQLAGQALRKSAVPADDSVADQVECTLSCRELREGLAQMLGGKDPETQAALQEIVERSQSKALPIAAAVFIAGVAAGAAAARP